MLSREGEAAGGRAARELQNAPYAVGGDLAATVTGEKCLRERVLRLDGECVYVGSEIQFLYSHPDDVPIVPIAAHLWEPLRRSST
jgi:hypothetical protein